MPWLEIPQGRMYFEEAGTGEPGILFAHGSACTHADWRFVLPELADRHSVASVDLRGYGASTAPAETCTIDTFADDLVRLVQHLGWSRAVLVGHSMSCRAVLQAAVDHPEVVVGVVIVDTTVTPRSLEEAERAAAGDGDDDPACRRVRFVEMLGVGVAPAERDRVLDHMSRVPRAVTETVVMSAFSWDAQRLERTAELLESPVLAIQTTVMDRAGGRRGLQPGESTPGLDVLQAARSGLETVVLPGLGHFPMLEKPGEVATQIAEFARRPYLNGSPPRPAGAGVETATRSRLLDSGE